MLGGGPEVVEVLQQAILGAIQKDCPREPDHTELARSNDRIIRLLHLAGGTEITRTLQAIGRDRTRILNYLPL